MLDVTSSLIAQSDNMNRNKLPVLVESVSLDCHVEGLKIGTGFQTKSVIKSAQTKIKT